MGEKSYIEKGVNMKKKLLALMLSASMVLSMTACTNNPVSSSGQPTDSTQTPATGSTQPQVSIPPVADLTGTDTSTIPGLEDGVLTVGMECVYAPYNWTQLDDSNGAVPIVNAPGSYANGYDVIMAKRICEAYGWELQVMAIGWEGLTPALDSSTVDVAISGQSMTEERLREVDMAGPYLYADIVCVAKKDSEQSKATGISQLTGTCTAQTGTVWYNSFLPQIPNAQIMPEAETAPAMITAVESGTVDFICTDMPTAMGAVATYDSLTILDFTNTDDNFKVADGDVNLGISVVKGNTALKDAINAALDGLTAEHFNALMAQAISIQPEI